MGLGLKYYPYASLDFIIGKDGALYFLEANAVSGGLFYTMKLAEHVVKCRPDLREHFEDQLKIIDLFIQLCEDYCSRSGSDMRKVAIAVPERWNAYMGMERRAIRDRFGELGYKAFFVRKSEARYRGDLLCLGDEVPDLVVRRAFRFPVGIAQPVVNPSEAGLGTENKWRTYSLVSEALKDFKLVKLPRTILARRREDLEEFLAERGEAVVKPLRSYGGKGVKLVKSCDEVSEWPVLVQERIEVPPLFLDSGRLRNFDLRVYVFDGEVVGAHLRTCPRSLSSCFVSNVSLGGNLVPVALCGEELRLERIEGLVLRYPKRDIVIEGSLLMLGEELSRELREASKRIVEAIDRGVVEMVKKRRVHPRR